MASRSRPVPKRRAVSAETGPVKNTQACAPTPDRDISSAAGNCQRSGRFQVRQRVQHRRLPIKVSGQPPAAIAIEQRIKPGVHLTGQVGGQELCCQWQILSLGVKDSLPPPTANRSEPASFPGCARFPTGPHTRPSARRTERRTTPPSPRVVSPRAQGPVVPRTAPIALVPAAQPPAATASANAAAAHSLPADAQVHSYG